MQEAFLQFVWELGLFNKKGLKDQQGQEVEIIDLGRLNRDPGPDFLHAKVRIDQTDWYGQIEIHVNGKDWYRHGHQMDEAFNSVILHVVWEGEDTVIRNGKNQEIPTVSLKHRIRKDVYEKYQALGDRRSNPPCGRSLSQITKLEQNHWLDRLLVERLEQRAETFKKQLEDFNGDWERLVMWGIIQCTGGNFNKEPFLRLANRIDPIRFRKLSNHPVKLEAMMLGEAGIFRGKEKDGYHASLVKEYKYLQHLYGWKSEKVLWTYGKIRPTGLPDRRIAALTATLRSKDRWLEWLIKLPSEAELQVGFLNPYWWTHYRLGKTFDGEKELKVPGLARLWLINAILPLSFLYGQMKGVSQIREKAIDQMHQLKSEENRIVRSFRKFGVECADAADSQALIYLEKNYCRAWRCLDCHWGATLLKSKECVID